MSYEKEIQVSFDDDDNYGEGTFKVDLLEEKIKDKIHDWQTGTCAYFHFECMQFPACCAVTVFGHFQMSDKSFEFFSRPDIYDAVVEKIKNSDVTNNLFNVEDKNPLNTFLLTIAEKEEGDRGSEYDQATVGAWFIQMFKDAFDLDFKFVGGGTSAHNNYGVGLYMANYNPKKYQFKAEDSMVVALLQGVK